MRAWPSPVLTPALALALAASPLLASGSTTTAPSVSHASPKTSRYVVVVGYNGPADAARPPLQWADDDAVRLFQQLGQGATRATLLTSFDADSARLWSREGIVARPPTRDELARTLGETYWQMREETGNVELVFALVGHGDVDGDGEGHVVLADGIFTRSDLERQVVQASPARTNHVIVDACAAYHLVARGDGAVPLPADLRAALTPVPGQTKEVGWDKTGVLVATSSAAATHESASMGGGVFSFVLRSALTGAADANGDGRVEYGEIAAFVGAANAAVMDPRARLDITSRPPGHVPHAALMDLRDGAFEHFLVVEEHSTRVRLIDARGLPWAELHREPGHKTLVALTGSPYFVVEQDDRQAVVVPRRRGAYAMSSLHFVKGLTSRSGADPITNAFFAIPYGERFIDGFVASGGALSPEPGPTFTVAWADDGTPPWQPPWAELATGSLVTAGVLGVAAMAAGVGNTLTLAELEAGFRQTGTLDPATALRADAFLTATGVLGASAVTAGIAGAAFMVAQREEP